MTWGTVSAEAIIGLAASVLSFLTSLFGAFKIGTKKWPYQKYALVFIGILLLISAYAFAITISYLNLERELNDRLRINKIRQQLYSEILPDYIEIIQLQIDEPSVKDDLNELLKKCEKATDKLSRIDIRQGGSSGNALEIYKQDNQSYLLILTASLYSKLQQPGRVIEAISLAEKAIKKVETQLTILEETFDKSGDGGIEAIIAWIESDGIKNRMHYTRAWIVALKRLNNLQDVPLAEFDLAVRKIEQDFIREYPLEDNHDIHNFLEEFNESLGTEFWDYYNELYPDSPFDTGAAQQDSTR